MGDADGGEEDESFSRLAGGLRMRGKPPRDPPDIHDVELVARERPHLAAELVRHLDDQLLVGAIEGQADLLDRPVLGTKGLPARSR